MKKNRLVRRFLLESFRQDKWKSSICCVSMVLMTLISVILPIVLQKIIDGALAKKV